MKKIIVTSLLFLLPPLWVQAQEIKPKLLNNVNFDAKYFESEVGNRYGVIVLGGSGGGRPDDVARRIAALGYNVLSLAYFDRKGSKLVPSTLELIPLEYFEEPKKWLMNRANTRKDGVILYGLSKGAELALVLAAYDKDYKAIVALAPSHVVWQGNPKNISNIMSSPSSWSLGGKGLPFVPYISNEEKEKLGFTNRHRASLTNKTAVENAKINVERIQSPVLLLSGGMDRSWPAFEMGSQICEKINAFKPTRCTHINYKDGGHLLAEYQNESLAEVEKFLHTLEK